jgi:hypothetical protein
MKWLIGFLLALFMVSAAFAGETPYIAIVGNDSDFNPFYFSPKHRQFLYDQTLENEFGLVFGPICDPFSTVPVDDGNPPQTRVCGVNGLPCPTGCEMFKSNKPINQDEVCDVIGNQNGEPNAKIAAGSAGTFEWWIRLPLTPEGEINICIQCGVLKPEEDSVLDCAAETGEIIGSGHCTRQRTGPGQSPIKIAALPKLEVKAYPGPFANEEFAPFHLTAYKNPSGYDYTLVPNQTPKKIQDGLTLQVLDGTNGTRVLLKSCMDKCVIAKIPVTNLRNSLNEKEADLTAGDLIQVRLTIPSAGTVDVYCHSQSAKIMGIGEPGPI